VRFIDHWQVPNCRQTSASSVIGAISPIEQKPSMTTIAAGREPRELPLEIGGELWRTLAPLSLAPSMLAWLSTSSTTTSSALAEP
jgi:hypothetical protein